MINIACALYQEAHFLINYYELRKRNDYHRFQVFENRERGLRVILTGVGMLRAAMAVSILTEREKVGEDDLLWNIGSCGAAMDKPCGSIFVCHKLVEEPTGHTFYPDILYKHPFAEATLISRMNPAEGKLAEDALYDMEGCGVYQAGISDYGPHRMLFLKVVSDHGDGLCQPLDMQRMMESAGEQVLSFLDRFLFFHGETGQDTQEKEETQKWEQKLIEDLHCSVTMEHELKQLLHYSALAGREPKTQIKRDYDQGILPCPDKREGKKYLEKLKAGLF